MRIMFRLPSGVRVERRFTPESKLEEVYHFMDVSDVCLPATTHSTTQKPPQQQVFKDQLKNDTDAAQLVLSFPKRTFTLSADGGKCLTELDLTGAVAVFVQDA